MRNYSLSHVRDDVLLRDLADLVVQDRITTADLLAHIAEVDARKLFAPAGYACMHAYCVGELRQSEGAALKRIRAARAARQYPALFSAIAEGRLHLSGVCLLASHLTASNASELIEAATHKSKSDIEAMLARRFGVGETPALVRAIPAVEPLTSLAPGPVNGDAACPAPRPVEGAQAGGQPLAAERYFIQVTVAKETFDKLRHAQALLSHAVPSGDLAEVLDRALDQLIAKIERRKAGTGTRPSRRQTASTRKRHIPADVRSAVWERDGRQCTFVSADGVRCGSRKLLEFDHLDPVARGGEATVDGIRLRCRAHNQYEAERVFGAGFMAKKREEAKQRAADRQAAAAGNRPRAIPDEQTEDLVTALRSLGLKRAEALRAAEITESFQDATLEDRVRAALAFLGARSAQGRTATVIRPAPST
jgi:5-methylcytosine-specific restriction endonuclease McrA